jgi:malate dehydrogenase
VGHLDSSLLEHTCQTLDKPANDISQFMVIGHGDTTMIPLTRLASYNGIPVSQFLSEDALPKGSRYDGGGSDTNRTLGTSAWYAPGASVAYLVDSTLNEQRKMIACSVSFVGRI